MSDTPGKQVQSENKDILEAIWRGVQVGNVEGIVAKLEAAGYVIVPKEPTEAMLNAKILPEDAATPWRHRQDQQFAEYRAMIAARPR